MGAWGYKALDNDDALDLLDTYLDKQVDLEAFITKLFSDSTDEYALVLGVALVYTALYGVDEDVLGSYWNVSNAYKHFFESLTVYDIDSFKHKAFEVIDILEALGVDGWSQDAQAGRMHLYHILKLMLR